MAYKDEAGIKVHNVYGQRETGGVRGMLKTAGYEVSFVVDLTTLEDGLYAYLFPRGSGVRVSGIDKTFVEGDITTLTIGGVDVSAATEDAPIELLNDNDGVIKVEGATGGRLVIKYKNLPGDRDVERPATPEVPGIDTPQP